MANPSLKAQIEAAKSALASDLAVPSLTTLPPKPSKPPTTPIMEGSDTATGANAAVAAALDKRITQLETKLLDHQRDLHTLLQKIREVSRLQGNSGQTHKNRAKDQAETMAINGAGDKFLPRHRPGSPVIMVALAALIGLVVGVAYFLVTAKGDLSALAVPSWIPTLIERFNGWIG